LNTPQKATRIRRAGLPLNKPFEALLHGCHGLLGGLKKRQCLLSDVFFACLVPIKPNTALFRAIFYPAITLLGHAVHQLGDNFEIVDFLHNTNFIHESPLPGHKFLSI
jgi:hypothetical protein